MAAGHHREGGCPSLRSFRRLGTGNPDSACFDHYKRAGVVLVAESPPSRKRRGKGGATREEC